jgi:copper transport protein
VIGRTPSFEDRQVFRSVFSSSSVKPGRCSTWVGRVGRIGSSSMGRRGSSRRGSSVGKKLLALVALVLVGSMAWATDASAHASVSSTSPESGSTVTQSPKAVTITFDQGVSVPSGGVRILNEKAERIGVEKPRTVSKAGKPNTVSVAIPKLEMGAYVVSWRAVSEDGHPIRGAFTFRVGQTGNQAAVARLARELLTNGNTDPALSLAVAIARVLSFASMVLLLGGVAYVLLIRTQSQGNDARVAKVLRGASVVAGLSGLAAVVLFGPFVAGESFGGLADGTLLDDTISTSIGRSMLLRAVALVVLGWLTLLTLHRLSTSTHQYGVAHGNNGIRRIDYAALLGVSFIVVGLSSAIGHGASGRWRLLGAVATGLHLAAASTWIGLLVMVLAATSQAGLPAKARAKLAKRSTPSTTTAVPTTEAILLSIERFSTVAFWSVVVLVLSGTLNGVRQTESLQGLTATSYGHLLLIKLGIVVVLVGLGWVSRRSLEHRHAALAEGKDLSPEPLAAQPDALGSANTSKDRIPPALAAIRRRMTIETFLAIAVVVVTALLVNSPPPIEVLGRPVTVTMHGKTLLLDTTVSPAQAGANRLHFYALTPEGQTQAVEAMTVTASMPASDIAPIDLKVVRAGPNHFQALNADLPVKGPWRFTVEVQLDTFTAESVAATVTIR